MVFWSCAHMCRGNRYIMDFDLNALCMVHIHGLLVTYTRVCMCRIQRVSSLSLFFYHVPLWQVSRWTWCLTRVANSDLPVSSYAPAWVSLAFFDVGSGYPSSGPHAFSARRPNKHTALSSAPCFIVQSFNPPVCIGHTPSWSSFVIAH